MPSYQDQGKYEQAESFYQRALVIREKVLGPEHPSTGSILYLWGQYSRSSERDEPLQFVLVERDFCPHGLYSLAYLYQDQGKYEQAESFHLHELAICVQTLGSEHSSTAKSLNCLAYLYQDQGKYEQADIILQS